jgi:hypothetical protein
MTCIVLFRSANVIVSEKLPSSVRVYIKERVIKTLKVTNDIAYTNNSLS